MHSDIADLMDGDKRSCDNCREIKESKYFPYKSKPLCLWCYEKTNNRTLYKKRQELGIIDSTFYEKNTPTLKKPSIRQSGSLKPNCPLCKSQKSESKGIRRGRRRYVCKRCRHNWTVSLDQDEFQVQSSVKKEEEVNREIPLHKIKDYLQNQYRKLAPIRFYYKDDKFPRESDNYSVDDKYITLRGRRGRKITFRIDRIRKI